MGQPWAQRIPSFKEVDLSAPSASVHTMAHAKCVYAIEDSAFM